LAALVEVFTHALPHTVSVAAQTTQLPAVQAAPATHWVLDVQLVTQAVAPQTNGEHGCVVDAAHAPAPLQPAMLVAVPLAQVGCRQTVPLPGSTQMALVPPQLPLQGDVPAQAGWPVRGLPVT
jgi:hypothetical protein